MAKVLTPAVARLIERLNIEHTRPYPPYRWTGVTPLPTPKK